MNHEREPTRAAGLLPRAGSGAEALAGEAAERRRLLLKSVGRGGALLAATVPLKTLAGQRLLTSDAQHLCSVSGMQSGIMSASPGSSVTCTGFTPSYFGQSKDGNKTPCNAWPLLPNNWNYKTSCRKVFTRSSLSNNPNLFQVLNSPTYASSDDVHWVCAWLNALSGGALNFPYTANQVMAYYANNDSQALQFFRGFMEIRNA